MVTMGLTHNFQGMMAARFFLGLAEAGLFPGINYYLSCWYKRDEFGIRAAIFFSAAAVSGSFGGLLAAAIGDMDGVGGKRGWAWVRFPESIITSVSLRPDSSGQTLYCAVRKSYSTYLRCKSTLKFRVHRSSIYSCALLAALKYFDFICSRLAFTIAFCQLQ